MMFRVFNSERGIWACEIDAFLYYMAYLALAFLFSFFVTLTIEMPIINCYKIFILGQKVYTDHLYDFSPPIGQRREKAEIGRKYEHLIKAKDSNSNSSDGVESLDMGGNDQDI